MELENMIINSGPGTGKTEYMKRKIQECLESGMKSEEIIGFTFTSAAARNMKERLSVFTGLSIQNIHSYCVNRLGHSLNIIPDDILNYLVKSMTVNKGYRNPENISASDINNALDTWRIFNFFNTEDSNYATYQAAVLNEMNIPEYIKATCGNDSSNGAKRIPKVIVRVISILKMIKNLGYVDFFDTVVYGYFNIREPQIKYILVDEFQDLTYIEYKAITAISPNAKYLFLCDTNQGIYSWRHSNFLQNVEHFKLCIGPLQEKTLTENYRCSKRVLALANLLADKQDTPVSLEEGSLEVYRDADWKDHLISKATKYNISSQPSLAIITQSNIRAGEVVNLLKENKIQAYHKIRNTYSETGAIRLFLKLVHYLQCPYNSSALKALCLDEFFIDKGKQDFIKVLKFFKESVCSDILIHGQDSVLYGPTDEQYVIFDTEATGTDYDQDDIIQIASIKLDKDFNEIDRLNIYLKTDKELGGSEQIHHISKAYLEENGLERQQGLVQALAFFKGCTLIAHNTHFDASILYANCKQYNLLHLLDAPNWMDTLDLARVYLKDKNPVNFKLESLVECLGLNATPNHNAMFDVEATVELFKYIINVSRNNKQNNFLLSSGIAHYVQDVIEEVNGYELNDVLGIFNLTKSLLPPKTDKDYVFLEGFQIQVERLIQKGFSVSALLEFFQLKMDYEESKHYNIVVCTIHQAKGLEFDDVILVQEYNSNDSADNKNAENVAVSRAKRNFELILLNPGKSRIAEKIRIVNNQVQVQKF